jgi:clan AA aspartic protease (TIGR02281 family)
LSLWIKFFCASGALIVLILASPSHSAIYKWKDEKGKIHFTDNLSKIPPKYRKKGELKTMKGAPAKPSKPVKLTLPQKKATVHVIKARLAPGGHYMVEVLLNGTVTAELIVDTGATMIMLSNRIGKQLGIYHNSNFPKIGMSTAGGTFQAPLFVLDSLKLGEAEVFNLEATTNPHLTGVDGLLGMSFLGEFKVEMDQGHSEMILRPLYSPGERLWGGKNVAWWQKKYKKYTGILRSLKRVSYNVRGNLQKSVENKKRITHYKKLHKILETRADRYNLPKEYRFYP